MSFYSPIYFLFLMGLVPIILMYLLKKKHREFQVSSNFLWEKAIRDIEANKPWQKLRKNLLLLLQIILFILLVLALTNPYLLSDEKELENLIIVLDTSASMQSIEGGSSRFNKAKAQIKNIVDDIPNETYITLINMENTPKVEISNSNNKYMIKDKLKNIIVTNKSDSIGDTLSLIKSFAKEYDNYRVLFYTDKKINIDNDNFIIKNLNNNGMNTAIEKISHSRSDEGIVLLTTISNYSDKKVNGDLSIHNNNEVIDIKEITLEAKESKDIYWDNLPNNINVIRGELDINDSLDIDNNRYHIINNKSVNKVLLTTKGNIFLEKGFSINNDIELYKTDEVMEDVDGYDLYVYDGMLPKELPDDGNIVIFSPNNTSFIEDGIYDGSDGIRIVSDDLFSYLDMNFSIEKTKILKKQNWGQPLITLNNKPILIKGENGNQKYIIVGFDLHNTDFPLKMEFPIFIHNILDYSLNMDSLKTFSVLSGESLKIDMSPKVTEAYITNPKGNREKIAPPFPIIPFSNTNEIGIYKLEGLANNETITNYFVSNVDTEGESINMKQYNQNFEIGENKEDDITTKRELRNIFIWIILILLLIEWGVYNRGY